jgi:hypothetical protein
MVSDNSDVIKFAKKRIYEHWQRGDCFRDMPQRKSLLESELWKNSPDLRNLILHLWESYSMDPSFKAANFQAKKGFSNIIVKI